MELYRCTKCGAMTQTIKPCMCHDCGIKSTCCGQPMTKQIENTNDGAVEKHKPVVEICGSYIVVTVNHVMEPDHYIEWIAYESDNTFGKKQLLPNQKATAIFPYQKNSKVYAFCNKHGLWSTIVE